MTDHNEHALSFPNCFRELNGASMCKKWCGQRKCLSFNAAPPVPTATFTSGPSQEDLRHVGLGGGATLKPVSFNQAVEILNAAAQETSRGSMPEARNSGIGHSPVAAAPTLQNFYCNAEAYDFPRCKEWCATPECKTTAINIVRQGNSVNAQTGNVEFTAPTPRTDAFHDKWDSYNYPHEAIHFARQLETELAAAKAEQDTPELWRQSLEQKPMHCVCLFEYRPEVDFSGIPPRILEQCGYHSEQEKTLQQRSEKAEAALAEANTKLAEFERVIVYMINGGARYLPKHQKVIDAVCDDRKGESHGTE